MKITRAVVLWVTSVAMMVLGTGVVSGQDYPNNAIRIITGSVGAGGDFMARLIAQGITGPLGQPVIVENRSGITRGETVAKAPPDGYTLLLGSDATWTGPLVEKTPYDVVRDFAPITMTDRAPSVIVVNPSVPVKSIKELIAFAKAKPGELNYHAGTPGSQPHLSMELLKSMAGINIVRISYKDAAVGMNDLLAGRDVQLYIVGPVPVIPHMKSGRLRALAITTAQPSALFPDLPTVAASGLPGYEFSQIGAMFAPAKTPDAIIRRLNQEIVRVLNRDDLKQKILSTGSEVVGSSPEVLAATMNSEIAKWTKVVKDAGIKAD